MRYLILNFVHFRLKTILKMFVFKITAYDMILCGGFNILDDFYDFDTIMILASLMYVAYPAFSFSFLVLHKRNRKAIKKGCTSFIRNLR